MSRIFMTSVLTIILLTCFLGVSSQPNTVLLIVDEYDKNKSKGEQTFRTSSILGYGVKFTSPSTIFRIIGIHIYGVWGYYSKSKESVGKRNFTIEIRDQYLNLLKSYSFKYQDYFNSFYDSILTTKIPPDTPNWAIIQVNVTISSGEFYIVVYPNGEIIPLINKANSLWIGTDYVGNTYPSKSSSYKFKEGNIYEKVEYNFLIRVEGIIIPTYSIKICTENLPSNLVLVIKNRTSRFELRGGETKIVKVCRGTDLFLENAIIYSNGVRYRCINPRQTITGPGDIVFKFYPEYRVNVSVKPEIILKYKSFKVNGTSFYKAFTGWFSENVIVHIEVPEIVEKENIRYIFIGFNTGANNSVSDFKIKSPIDIVANYKIQYYVKVDSKYGSVSGEGWYDKGSRIMIKVNETIISITNDIRYAFLLWEPLGLKDPICMIMVDSPMEIKAKWVKQYRVEASSPYGNVILSSEWVTENETVKIELTPTSIPTGFLTQKVFSHWVDQYGNIYHGNPMEVKVTGILKLKAIWKDDYTQIFVVLVIVLLIVFLVVFILYKYRKRVSLPPPPPPPLL